MLRLAEPLPLRIGPPPARPRIVLSETAPGPTWVPLTPARGQGDGSRLLSALAKVLGSYGAAGGPSTPRLVSLTEQADALVASEGLSWRDALRRASIEDPAAYQRWRQQIRPGVQ